MRSLSITGHWNVSLPSGVSPWNSIFGPGRGSKYNNNTDNNVFKREFYTKETGKKGTEKIVLQILVQFVGNLSERVSGETKFFEFEYFSFLFLFYQEVSEIIKFRVFFKVLFSRILGWIFFQLHFFGWTSVVDFHLFSLLFLGELHSGSQWQNPSAGLSFSCL